MCGDAVGELDAFDDESNWFAPIRRRHFFEAARTRVKTISFAVFCESAPDARVAEQRNISAPRALRYMRVLGVGGTPGALLALVGAVATAAGAALATAPGVGGGWLAALNALLFLAAALTALAAFFLMQQAFAVAMAVAAVGLLLALVVRPRRRTV